jgi:uncharacterized protein (TIGR00369 family)
MPRNLDSALGDGGMPLLAQLGLTFERYGEGWAEASWRPTELACNPLGAVHGGVYGVVHDAAMNFAASSALERGDRATTLDVGYQIIRASGGGETLRVRGEVVRLATSVGYLESTVRDPGDRLISRATATFFLRRRDA